MSGIHIFPKGNKFLMKPVLVPDVLSKKECNLLLEQYVNQLKFVKDDISLVNLTEVKLPGNEWFFERIMSVITEMNNKYFHFGINDLRSLNLLEYREGFYMEWHSDISKKNESFISRKLTLSVALSEADEYEGGNIIFQPEFKLDSKLKKGTALVYPSFVYHKVEPVTSGIRRIIIASAHGEAFR